MHKILVVDDEADLALLIRQKFRRQIKADQYAFVFAENGNQALDQISYHADIDLVLSDINMPGMDGLTLLEKINELLPLTKTVMVSAYGDMDNIRMAMNRGAFDFVVKPVNFEDLEQTIQKTLGHVEQLKNTMKAIKENDILKMYVDDHVLNFMGSREFESSLTANETIEATVLFIDICHFTAISEKETPDTVVQILNQYFDLMVQEIIVQQGQIDKFMGDSVMAIFKGEQQLERAIHASLAIKDQVKKRQEQPDNHFPLEVSIGINKGEVISGNIGSASLKRLDYTVIGDAVNLAQRLEAAAQPNQILITADSYKAVKNLFSCNSMGEIRVKNKEDLIEVYEVVG